MKLNEDQENALDKFIRFLAMPSRKDFVINGPAGAGKGYILKYIFSKEDSILDRASVINPKIVHHMVLTATTNEAVSQLAAADACTIYALAGLVPDKKIRVKAIRKPDLTPLCVFVDESSYIDEPTYKAIKSQLPNCKFVWVMDDAQLAPVGSRLPYIPTQKFPTVELNKIERNKGDLQTLSMDLRKAVRSQIFLPLGKYHNGTSIEVVDRNTFEQKIVDTYKLTRNPHEVRILAFKNKTVTTLNNAVHMNVLKEPKFPNAGCMATVNKFNEFHRLRVGKQIRIQKVFNTVSTFTHANGNTVDIPEWKLITNTGVLVMPMRDIPFGYRNPIWREYVDLTLPYASTTHKAQGSTIDTVFVDAANIKEAPCPEMIRRLLYVAISRAASKVVITL